MDDGEDDVMMLDGVPEQLVIDTKDSEIDGTARESSVQYNSVYFCLLYIEEGLRPGQTSLLWVLC